MMHIASAIALIFSTLVTLAPPTHAQRPDTVSICNYYTNATFRNNTMANQLAWVGQVMTTAFAGNHTPTPNNVPVVGFLNPGVSINTPVDVRGFFNGTIDVAFNPAGQAVPVNYLNDGGIPALNRNQFANTTNSTQYKLFSGFTSFFANLFNCSEVPLPKFNSSLTKIHSIMDLQYAQVQWFITNIENSLVSLNVSSNDAGSFQYFLTSTFSARCSPPVALFPQQSPQLQSICFDNSCPLAQFNADCDPYVGCNTTSGCLPVSSSVAPIPSSTSSTIPSITLTPVPSNTDVGTSSNTGAIAGGVVGGVVGLAVLVALILFVRRRQQASQWDEPAPEHSGNSEAKEVRPGVAFEPATLYSSENADDVPSNQGRSSSRSSSAAAGVFYANHRVASPTRDGAQMNPPGNRISYPNEKAGLVIMNPPTDEGSSSVVAPHSPVRSLSAESELQTEVEMLRARLAMHEGVAPPRY